MNTAGGYRYDYGVLPAGAAPSRIAELDVQTVRTGLNSLHASLKAGRRVMIAIPVHFETLAMPKTRDQYIQALRSLPMGMRDLLTFELCEIGRASCRERVCQYV